MIAVTMEVGDMEEVSKTYPWKKEPTPNKGDLGPTIEHSVSAFDRIRSVRPDGTEYWSARDLQPLMGYATWERFKSPLFRARQSAENTGIDLTSNFRRSAKDRGGPGPAQEDYQLSRECAYLVAMNGDPNKPEVAEAQAYFAGQTREAEVAQQEHDELPVWAQQQIETIRRVGKIEVEQMRQRERLDDVEHRLDGIEGRHDWFSALAWARRHKLSTSVAATRSLGKRAAQICREKGIAPGKTQHERYGEVNTYPATVLAEASGAMSTPA
ncbi:hypothetical protein [Prauserella cavernicola]|uniref:Bro-N domain-containing protein n=1 Tax=Prauserella cavernicola TaxID=2800127 RepID=A0A934QT21_9PSEU|nr:hypothetical protein [Prauserella cavernicola]MBK1785149.1 hypothetical protein [Prauserella cavernicola]